MPHMEGDGHLLVVNGDAPLLTADVLNHFLAAAEGADVAFLSLVLDDAVAGRPLDPVWQREVLQISHRPYSTGFYFGQPGQYTANSAYFAGAEVCAVGEGTAPGGRAVLTQRNKFSVGDTLELVTNAAPPVTFTAQDLRDADGLPLESVPHPMQRFTMPLPCRAAPLSLVRRKLPAETVDIRLECGKI